MHEKLEGPSSTHYFFADMFVTKQVNSEDKDTQDCLLYVIPKQLEGTKSTYPSAQRNFPPNIIILYLLVIQFYTNG